LGAILALLLLPLLWKNHHNLPPTVAVAARKPARITIEHVNDEQLLSLLHGTPAALWSGRMGSHAARRPALNRSAS